MNELTTPPSPSPSLLSDSQDPQRRPNFHAHGSDQLVAHGSTPGSDDPPCECVEYVSAARFGFEGECNELELASSLVSSRSLWHPLRRSGVALSSKLTIPLFLCSFQLRWSRCETEPKDSRPSISREYCGVESRDAGCSTTCVDYSR